MQKVQNVADEADLMVRTLGGTTSLSSPLIITAQPVAAVTAALEEELSAIA